jgi:glycogen debranching enzyme
LDDVIRVHDQFYILATAMPQGAERHAVLQQDDTFAVFDMHGDIAALYPSEQGLYHEGTRYLSRFCLRVNAQRPLLLSARVNDENELFGADLTNPDLPLAEPGQVLQRDIIHLFRARFLWDGTLHERMRLWNYGRTPVRLTLTLDVEADFADIFEVRGAKRARRGTIHPPAYDGRRLVFAYDGLDGERRRTVVELEHEPRALPPSSVGFDVALAPHSSFALGVTVSCVRDQRPVAQTTFDAALGAAKSSNEREQRDFARVHTSSDRFDQWTRRAVEDLRMLVSKTPYGPYPYAGVPWFATPFGRDGIITALQTLWVNPRLARGVLEFLAATQAEAVDAASDAEPGKILHEMRSSEMARLGEVPFGRYYGSADATPLFVVLAGAYFDRTGDRAFLERIWPHVERALAWIDRWGDRDGDGFVEYERRSEHGLVQQGWKDSHDSVFHADGALAPMPIALCEVQAYVYDARTRAAAMALTLGHGERAAELARQAAALRDRFEERFWCEEESTYALALDGEKRPCRVRTSNAGHCLFSGIASPQRARRVAELLVSHQMFSGWGMRTVASSEVRYNPMSYHNGSIWPHDNAILVAGLSRYGFDDLIDAPMTALFDATMAMDDSRLPELFCGFHRRAGEGPTLYPVACSPQAWASGAVFHLLQSMLRLSIEHGRLVVHRAHLPPMLDWVRVTNLELPFGRAELLFERHSLDVGVTVLAKHGEFDVCVVK